MYLLIVLVILYTSSLIPSYHHNFTYLYYTNHPIYIPFMLLLFSFLTRKCIALKKHLMIQDMYYIPLCFLTCGCMLTGSFLPYSPGTQDLFSSLHVGLTICGFLGQIWILIKAKNALMFLDFSKGRAFETYLRGLFTFVFLIIVMIGSISIIIEVSTLFYVLFLVYYLENLKLYN